jgi:hypothetical protein
VRRPRPKIVLTVPELLVVCGLVLYGVGALGFAAFGPLFFVALAALVVPAAPFAAAAIRRRRRRLARLRAERRRARVASYSEPWLEWEEAA